MKLIERLARRSHHNTAAQCAETERENSASESPGMGFTQTTSMPNIFGGYDQYRNGSLISSSRPNIFGGFDTTVFSLSGTGNGGLAKAFGHVDSALSDILGYQQIPDDEL